MNAGRSTGTQWGRAVLESEKASEATIEKEFPDVDVQWFNSWNVKPADVKSIVERYVVDGVQLIETGDFTQPQFKKIIEAHPDIYFIEPAFTLAETPNALADAMRDVLKGTFNHPFYQYKLKDGTVTLAPFRQHEAIVSDILRKELKKVVELSKAGELELYPVEKFPPELTIK